MKTDTYESRKARKYYRYVYQPELLRLTIPTYPGMPVRDGFYDESYERQFDENGLAFPGGRYMSPNKSGAGLLRLCAMEAEDEEALDKLMGS